MADNISLKAVRVVVYDDGGNVLATNDKGGDISVVSFSYKFDDENPDECTIKLQTSDPIAFDKIQIGRSQRLQVSWGYVSGPMTYPSIVVIRDLETKYGNNVIYTELKCTDLLTYATVTRAGESVELTMVQHLYSQFFKKYQIVIKDSNQRIWSLGLTEKGESNKISYTNYSIMPVDPYEMFIPYDPLNRREPLNLTEYVPLKAPEVGPYKPIEAEIITYTGELGTWYVDNDNTIRQWLEKLRPIVHANRSQFMVIRDFFKECPNGPWYITGRGQTILIHNRDFVSRPVRVYMYQQEPGDLIDFRAKTKYDQFEKNAVGHEIYNPQTKKFYELGAYHDELFSMASFKEKFDDRNLNELEFQKWLIDWVDLLKAYEKWKVTRVPITFYDDTLELEQKVYISDEGIYGTSSDMFKPPSKGIFLPDMVQDNTKMKQPVPYLSDVILKGHIYSRPLQFLEDRGNFIKNQKREMEMEKEEGEFKVVGDPFLQSQMRIQVENVHWQHKGGYYIKVCEHIITDQGYKTEMECLKVLAASRIRYGDQEEEFKVLENGEPSVDIIKQYAQEEKLFGNPIKIVIKGTPANVGLQPYPSSAGTGMALSFTPGDADKVYDVVQEMNKGNFVQTMVELRKNNKAVVMPNVEDN